jgi:sigma-B regulation protein RsbU (phosphoserine phosphatase)
MMVEELKNAQRIVDQKYQELNTLFELGKEFNRNLDTEVIVRLLTYSLMGQVGVNRYAICLCADGVPHVVTARLEGGENIGAAASRLGGLLNAALVSELARRKRYADAAMELEALGVQAVVPMVTQNTQKGLILLGPRIRGNAYTERDLQFVSSLGNLAIISIENVRLFKEALEKQRLEEDLKIAREIQQGLLPLDLPRVPGYELAAVNVSSRQVGGDYYDAVLLTDHQLALAIGDVSGKGTPAALLMSNVQAALRALAPLGQSIQETTGRINDLTCRNTGGDKFITLFWGILDTVTHVFTYVNAGHNYPFLLRGSGAIERLEEGGMILGIMATAVPYAEGTVVLRPGDVLFMFTDGVSEAMNSNGEDLTEEKLQEMLTSVRSLSASQIIREVTRGIEEHVGGAPQADDLTMLVLKRTA